MRTQIERFFIERERAISDGYSQGECHFTPASSNVQHRYRDQRFVKPRDHFVLEGGHRPAICDECSDAYADFLAARPVA